MKTALRSLLPLVSLYILPTALCAQPTVSMNEFYYTGDVIQWAKADPSSVSAGAGGANVTWDFTTISPTGGTAIMTVMHDTSSEFLTSNLLFTLPNGLKQHVSENSTDTYVNGQEDTTTGIVISYNNYDIAKRPITYMTFYTDTYRVSCTTPFTTGTGLINTMGDGYGTLELPSATYANVLRVKKIQSETDTVGTGSGTAVGTTTISYLWFDTIHHAPLLRIDSVIGAVGAGNTVMYLMPSTSVKTVNNAPGNFTCNIHDNDLSINGDFIYGKVYDVVVYSIVGSKIYSTEFTAAGEAQRLDMQRQVNPGIYIVSIVRKDDPYDKTNIKVVKQ